MRKQGYALAERLADRANPFVQVIEGPRKSGKSILAAQAVTVSGISSHIADIGTTTSPGTKWIIEQWQHARDIVRKTGAPCALIFEGVHERRNWASAIEKLWSADRMNGILVKPVIITDDLMRCTRDLDRVLIGCYQVISCPYWTFKECAAAFGFSIDEYLFFGGIPGACALVEDPTLWRSYILSNIVAYGLSDDVLSIHDIRKPDLLESYLRLLVEFSAKELSYNKALGYLEGVENTVTLARYLEYFKQVGLVFGIERFRPDSLKKRRSSPRIVPFDNGISNAVANRTYDSIAYDSQVRGVLVESAVGSHLAKIAPSGMSNMHYWRDGNRCVDFVLYDDNRCLAIDVESGRIKRRAGMGAFLEAYPQSRYLVVEGAGPHSCPLGEFLSKDSISP